MERTQSEGTWICYPEGLHNGVPHTQISPVKNKIKKLQEITKVHPQHFNNLRPKMTTSLIH